MDHVVIPLDEDHARALARVRRRAGAATTGRGHITIASFTGLDQDVALAAVRRAVAQITPFFARAHGYGFFVGEPGDANLHVPVVRDEVLGDLHASVAGGLRGSGAALAGWMADDLWSPHITVVEGGLDGDALAAAVAGLARRHHPSWRLPVRCVLLVGGRDALQSEAPEVPLAG